MLIVGDYISSLRTVVAQYHVAHNHAVYCVKQCGSQNQTLSGRLKIYPLHIFFGLRRYLRSQWEYNLGHDDVRPPPSQLRISSSLCLHICVSLYFLLFIGVLPWLCMQVLWHCLLWYWREFAWVSQQRIIFKLSWRPCCSRPSSTIFWSRIMFLEPCYFWIMWYLWIA